MSRERNRWSWSSHRRRQHSLSRSNRAELQFPVSRLDRLLRLSPYAQRLSSSTPIFLAGILEYLAAHILDLAGVEARSSHDVRITPEHVQRALDNHEYLSRLFQPGAFPRVSAMPVPEDRL
ncbi:histone H2A-Bbd type 1-like [Camelus ferus]|uniref:Histone H2A n=1 Tax=Camelus ferus TaxID=419612 RepID=A0A8B8SLD1_CAMFR|nr:histone H2A-Bbd type 1-like [Camelus ferus]